MAIFNVQLPTNIQSMPSPYLRHGYLLVWPRGLYYWLLDENNAQLNA